MDDDTSSFCANCRAPIEAGACACAACGTLQSSPTDVARLGRLLAGMPATLVARLRASAELNGAQRTVSALFVNLQIQAPESFAPAQLDQLLLQLMPPIYRYEGTPAQLVGTGLLALFGIPAVHEDDPIRAVRAALDLLALSRDLSDALSRQYGLELQPLLSIHTGTLLVQHVGADLHYTLAPGGDTLLTVLRLQQLAAPFSLLLSEQTRRFVAPLLDLTPIGTLLPLAGSAARTAYRVDGLRPVPGRVRGLDGIESPMVGRDTEMQTLERLSAAVRAGLGRIAVVIGEPGLGKSRLISEWRVHEERRPASLQWMLAQCLSYGQGQPYHLLIQLVRALFALPNVAEELEMRAQIETQSAELFGEHGAEIAAFLIHLLGLPLDPAAEELLRPLDPPALRRQYLSALRGVLQALCDQGPLVLVLEDIHWSDPSSVELLMQLLPLARELPLLFVLVTRPDRDVAGWRLVAAARELTGGGLTELWLSALSEQESALLVSNLLAIDALPAALSQQILKKAEGNPFFVEEVIRMLIDRGAITRRDERWVATSAVEAIDIPDTLQGLLLARIDRLPAHARHTLLVASVIGRRFPLRVLDRVLRKDLP